MIKFEGIFNIGDKVIVKVCNPKNYRTYTGIIKSISEYNITLISTDSRVHIGDFIISMKGYLTIFEKFSYYNLSELKIKRNKRYQNLKNLLILLNDEEKIHNNDTSICE